MVLRLVARHADVWNISGGGPEDVKRHVARFEEACAQVDRDPASVRRSLQFGWDGRDRNQLLELSAALLEQGVTEQVIYLREQPVALAGRIAELLPELRRLSPAG